VFVGGSWVTEPPPKKKGGRIKVWLGGEKQRRCLGLRGSLRGLRRKNRKVDEEKYLQKKTKTGEDERIKILLVTGPYLRTTADIGELKRSIQEEKEKPSRGRSTGQPERTIRGDREILPNGLPATQNTA